MLLKNYYRNIINIFSFGETLPYINYVGDTISYNSSDTGLMRFAYTQNPSYYSNLKNVMNTKNFSSAGVIFGDGTKEPTLDDYFLSGNQVTGFTFDSTVSCSVDDDGATVTGKYTITNHNADDITISEAGIIGSLATSNTSPKYRCMVERTLLDTPVTIPAGGVGQVTYTIRVNYPTA